MALNKQIFRTRAISAIIFAMLMLAGLLWNQWSFLALFSIIHFGCWWEYLGLMEKIHKTGFHIYTKLGLMVMGYGLLLWFCGPTFSINGYGIKENLSLPVTAAGFAILLLGIFQKKPVQPMALLAALAGIVYISLAWGFMIDLYHEKEIQLHDSFYVISAKFIPLVLVCSIWINDTMAYIVGSLLGKTPLTKISPKKTWEGTIGGIILSVVVVAVLLPLAFFSASTISIAVWVAIIALIASVTGTVGDLFESKLKRMANVKDSGSMMPGHGGFLDRFDSMLFAIVFVWVFLRIAF